MIFLFSGNCREVMCMILGFEINIISIKSQIFFRFNAFIFGLNWLNHQIRKLKGFFLTTIKFVTSKTKKKLIRPYIYISSIYLYLYIIQIILLQHLFHANISLLFARKFWVKEYCQQHNNAAALLFIEFLIEIFSPKIPVPCNQEYSDS